MAIPEIVFLIPVLNEEESLPKVLADLPRPDKKHRILICDNGSDDRSPQIARAMGADVVIEPMRGYGAACLKGLEFLAEHYPQASTVVFLDGDYSDTPAEWKLLVDPIRNGECDMVIGSRVSGHHEKGALLPQARFGNWLSTRLIRLFWKFPYTDLGPFRAISYSALLKLNMEDRNFGWTVEMQIRALKQGLRVQEIPVSYKKRIGKSKVTGTLKGSLMAGIIILKTIFKELFSKSEKVIADN